jgi:hypothetical protein
MQAQAKIAASARFRSDEFIKDENYFQVSFADSGAEGVFGMPMPGDIDTFTNPYIIMSLNVVKKTL